jgi:hypothetical protein
MSNEVQYMLPGSALIYGARALMLVAESLGPGELRKLCLILFATALFMGMTMVFGYIYAESVD